MPKPHQRTRSRKRHHLASPGGKTQLHYKKEVLSMHSCSHCGQPLGGIPHLSTSEMRKLNRSKRRIYRPYGGQLCHNCLRTALKQAAREL